MEDILLPVDDGTLNVWRRPADPGMPTVVLIHGLSGTSRWWLPVVSGVNDGLGLIVFDVRGRGQSWQAPGPYELTRLAGDVLIALDHFDLDSAHIAGYSMGGWIAALFALAHPERVRRLLLVDGGLAGASDRAVSADTALERAVGPSLQRLSMMFDTPADYHSYWMGHPALEGSWSPVLEEVFTYELHQVDGGWRVRANQEAIRAGGAEITINDEVRPAAGRVTVPAILLTVDHGLSGEPGGFVPLDLAEEAAAANSFLDVRFHPGLNHFTLLLGRGAPIVTEAINDI